MVALMRFTRDIYRLLGLASDASEQREENMETEVAADAELAAAPQEVVSGEEELSEEEKARRRAERRRAKRKRQKERKKLEKDKQNENVEQEESGDERRGQSEEEDEEPDEEEEVMPQKEEKAKHKAQGPAVKDAVLAPPPTRKSSLGPPLASGSRANRQPTEEEPEWDVSSAFVASVCAVSHLKPKARSQSARGSRENKENQRRPQTNCPDSGTKKSAYLTEKGIQLVQEGHYSQAVTMFTEAIKHDPLDYRFFGNRSYCYECLEDYRQALGDAETSIRLEPSWPKGYYRKGSALMGLKRYAEAERAMEQVLALDQQCEEAANELFNCRVLQLMDHGFEEMQSVMLLEKYTTVQAALSSVEATVPSNESSDQTGGPSLWVGNVTTELTEKHLKDLFKTCGEIDSVRVLHERFCAFVNYKTPTMAARALERLNGYSIENTRLVVRYPDRRVQRPLPLTSLKPMATLTAAEASGARRRGPVNGDECYFWRTTGCHFGEKCRYKHIPEQRGKDRRPWQP
ncbi:uncharacterized protein zgc:123010 isoform X2 [Engraulis encrasicolus]|uniref:uncharacterized protein zgc:123010 isoform X2 n=1 Tax=Engraulis encrasicolus TaxID=184585 RepID=UPI002FCF874F